MLILRGFAALSFVILASASHADELLERLPAAADVPPAARESIQVLQALPTTESVEIVRVSPEFLRSSSDLTIALDERDILSLEKTASAETADKQYVWSGTTPAALAMGGGIEGAATIAVNDGKVSASIRTSEGVFRLQPLADGLHALIKIKQSGFPAEHPNSAPSPRDQQRDINRSELRKAGDDSIAEISVLVAATTAAAAKIDLQGFAQLAVNVSNESFNNSGIHAKFKLAGTYVSNYKEAGSHEADLAHLADGTDGVLDDITKERDSLSADVVVLLTNDDSYCGLARDIFANSSNAFATVYWLCAVDNLSFPHEIGHLLGACHNPEVNPDCSPFAYGHGFLDAGKRMRTVMAYDCLNHDCPRTTQWARPPVWGDDSVSYDAKVIEETSPRAAQFR